MKRSGTSRLHKYLSSLPGRIVLVVLTTIVIAAVIPLLFLFNQMIMPVALKIIAIACVGIASGFAVRKLLNAKTRLLNMLVAFIAVYASLWLLSVLTAGYIGIQPLQAWSGPDWNGLIQLALGTIIAWLALQAWRRPNKAGRITTVPARSRNQTSRTAASKRRKVRQASTPKRRSKRKTTTRKRVPSHPDRQLPQFVQSQYWNDKWKNAQIRTRQSIQASQSKLSNLMEQPVNRVNSLLTRPRGRTKSLQKPIQVRARKPHARPQKKPRTSVRFTGAVEHRCPFCLEPVDKKDARGVKICPICHTHHHADCWEVTGTCQVPHIHE